MSTYTKIVLHFTFSTRHRRPWLTKHIRNSLFPYIGGIIRNQRGAPIAINGVEDHVHILAHVKPHLAISAFMREVKKGSSEYVHKHFELRAFAWQEGFAAFSVRGNDYQEVLRYVERQEEHHRVETFPGELRRLLDDAGVEVQERYLLG